MFYDKFSNHVFVLIFTLVDVFGVYILLNFKKEHVLVIYCVLSQCVCRFVKVSGTVVCYEYILSSDQFYPFLTKYSFISVVLTRCVAVYCSNQMFKQ